MGKRTIAMLLVFASVCLVAAPAGADENIPPHAPRNGDIWYTTADHRRIDNIPGGAYECRKSNGWLGTQWPSLRTCIDFYAITEARHLRAVVSHSVDLYIYWHRDQWWFNTLWQYVTMFGLFFKAWSDVLIQASSSALCALMVGAGSKISPTVGTWIGISCGMAAQAAKNG